jgi:hypothetical protein
MIKSASVSARLVARIQTRVLPYDDGRIIVKYRFAKGRAIVTGSTLETPQK